MKLVKLKTLGIKVVIAGAILLLIWCPISLWYYATHTGSRSGFVVDADTRKPIEGAIVDYTWTLSGILGDENLTLGTFCETTTNPKGEYYIPSHRIKRRSFIWESPKAEIVVIYKRGYFAYQFYGPYSYDKALTIGVDGYQDYRKKGNRVKLYPCEKNVLQSHQIEWIHSLIGFSPGGTLMRRELNQVENQMRDIPAVK